MKKVILKFKYNDSVKSISATCEEPKIKHAKSLLSKKAIDYLSKQVGFVDDSDKLLTNLSYVFTEEHRVNRAKSDYINSIVESFTYSIEEC